MGFFNIFKGQFIDVIEWPDENPQVLVHRFDRHNNEIKMGARLIVRPGQKAIFVNEGKIADHFGPGTYKLHTKNMPILTTLLSLPYNFQSPFKAEVYFIRTTEQLDRKWGTSTPVMMRDADFGIIRLRARGNFSYKVGESNDMLARFSGARSEFTCDDIEGQMKAKVVSAISDALGELKVAALDLAAMYNEIGALLHQNLGAIFSAQGFELISFTVENISLPEAVNEAMDKRSSLGALNGVMGQYTQLQAADAMRAAAENPGGAGNMMGVLMGAQLGNTAGAAVQQGVGAAPPPLPVAPVFFVASDGGQSGPFDLATLKANAANGSFTAETLVWRNGMAEWQPAKSIPELAAILPSVPPPATEIVTNQMKFVAITGPTASGKTTLAVKLARHFNGEIISADSRQVFRGMDLGTGKDLAEYQEIPYHLIDIVDPTGIYHLKRFMDDSAVALAGIIKRGALPFFCGGTALYLDAILRGYELSGGEPDFLRRDELRVKSATELAKRLRALSPELYLSLDAPGLNNHERLLRMLEKAQKSKETTVNNEIFKRCGKLIIGVYFPRSEIRSRIAERLERRFSEGMIEEVAKLHDNAGVSWERLELFGLEYRAIAEYLQGKTDLETMRNSLLIKIRQFAKRQDIWFRKMERSGLVIHWIEKGDYEQSAKLIEDFLNHRQLPQPKIRLNDIRYG